MKTLLVLLAFSSHAVMADVYFKLSETDEIIITNTEANAHYADRIEEPISLEQAAFIDQNNSMALDKLPFNKEVIVAAKETAIEPALIHAVMTVESRHNSRARSKKGAYGLMQLMPETARRFKVVDSNDPKQNILAGAKYLRELLNLFHGDLKLTLAAYNAGPAAVQKYFGKIPPYKETVEYVPKVMKYYRQYS